MPRILTEAFIKNLQPATAGKRYVLADAMVPGLKLRVTEHGTKTFVLCQTCRGRSQSGDRRKDRRVGS